MFRIRSKEVLEGIMSRRYLLRNYNTKRIITFVFDVVKIFCWKSVQTQAIYLQGEEDQWENSVHESDGHKEDNEGIIDESLHALASSHDRKTITVQGSIKGESIRILIYTGGFGSYLIISTAVTLALYTYRPSHYHPSKWQQSDALLSARK